MLRHLVTFMLLTATLDAIAQDVPKPEKIFSSDEVLSVTMEGPWRTIERRKSYGDEWQGTFSYESANGTVSIPITIRPRGLTRLAVCDFPPLRIGFDKDAAKGTAFRGAGNLKLVTHCLRREKYQAYAIKEYLGYRIYNLVTEKSYRVQGLDVRYVDNENGKVSERFAFLIEDPDDVAKRNDLVKLNIDDTTPAALDPDETSRFMIFQYLIANLDWAALGGPDEICCHNARLIGTAPDARPVFALPYDLDSSGLVNAHYAAPPEGLRVRTIRQRLFRGFCRHNDAVPGAVQAFNAQRDAILALFNDEPRLEEREREWAVEFLEDYFEEMSEADGIESLTDNCRG